ncbi:MAG TPA: hypothetical protein VFV23_06560 [Verrucomicrobiae bacterium]|nr:hypothetical protein [Verrucomicrobiae bacterium]
MKTNCSIRIPRSIIRNRGGWLQVDLAVGLAILGLAILPLAFSFAREQKLVRAEYTRAAAMEIVDGEMEILAAGDWKRFPDGTQNYPVHAKAAANLPGHFQLTKTANHLLLEWLPDKRIGAGTVAREIAVK